MKYTVTIKWSELDQCFVVFLPEFKNIMQPVTHGNTYSEAAKNATEVLEMLVEEAQASGESLPEPQPWHSNAQVA